MDYFTRFVSPLGELTLASDGEAVTGLWFSGQKYDRSGLREAARQRENLPEFLRAEAWLDAYFSGRDPGPVPPVRTGGTPFQELVWARLRRIPYGGLTTYGRIARDLAAETGAPVSARAVGGAVGRNPVSILIPCHRVVGSGGRLTGYAGGVDKKAALLSLEGVDSARLRSPEHDRSLEE